MMPTPKSDPIVPVPPAVKLTYEQSAALMMDMNFRGRVKVSCLKYSTAIFDEPTDTAAHNTKLKWAAECAQNPDAMAQKIQNPVVMDAQVQQDGSAITDVALQASVETTINKLM